MVEVIRFAHLYFYTELLNDVVKMLTQSVTVANCASLLDLLVSLSPLLYAPSNFSSGFNHTRVGSI